MAYQPVEILTGPQKSAMRSAIGLGTAATTSASDYASASQGALAAGAAQKASNLGDLADAATARTNLGLGTAATTEASAYATAAQGAKADTAVQPADIAKMVESDVTGITGADAITNIVSLTTAEYNAIGSKSASTFYIITDA